MPLHTLRKRHASFAQKDYNGIIVRNSPAFDHHVWIFFDRGLWERDRLGPSHKEGSRYSETNK